MTYSKKTVKWLVLPLLSLTIVIDVIGAGLVFPLLSSLFMQGGNSLFSADTGLPLRYLCYGLAFLSWPLGAFLGSPYLGKLSDSYGRKKILALSLFINSLGYLVSAGAVFVGSVWIFITSRVITGLFAGGYDVAQAAAIDVSTPETKSTCIGVITIAFTIGTVIGPVISGFTSIETYSKLFSIETPFIIASGLSALSSLLIMLFLRERTFIPQKIKVDFSCVFSSFSFIFKDRRVAGFGMIYLIMNIGWGLFFSAVPIMLNIVFDLKADYTGLYFCIMGLGNLFSLVFLNRGLTKPALIKKTYIMSSVIVSILMLVAYWYPDIKVLTAIGFLFGLVEILTYTSCLTLLSNAVPENMQGQVMGGAGSLYYLALVISGGLIAVLSYVSCLLPVLLAGLMYLMSSFFMYRKRFVKKITNELA